ncbi:MAG: type VI secretion system tip protein TssI/VgrG [Minicystis sp.]
MSELYTLTIDGFPPDHFKVHSFTGREKLSEPYAFDVVVTSDAESDEDVERLALGQRAVLSWSIGMVPRAFHGVLAAAELVEIHEAAPRAGRYRLRLVPRLWLLKRKRRSRIFQQMRVPDIVASVLAEVGVKTRWILGREHPLREYCTQYEESDYRFVARLLAESGVYFFFPQGPLDEGGSDTGDRLIPGDSLVLGDDTTGYPALGEDEGLAPTAGSAAPALHYLSMQQTNASHRDKITHFSARTTVRASSANFRDYDPDRPMASLVSSAQSTAPFPGEAVGAALEVYDHHGPFLFPKWSFARDEAPLMLRQKRRRAAIASGESGCPDLAPGHRFTLEGHPATHLNHPYMVVSVEHRGEARPQGEGESRTYENTFTCAPAEVVYIPPRPKRKSVQVALTATVAGPPGEEIHVDALGQIKVQLHWDRDGSYDDRSSCWIRTMHAWGGAGWGAQFIPRVGMEVVVVFEGGDTDKPMILGALYNGTHPPPFSLPLEKTRSGFRTQSSPGGGGANELSFEDAAAKEQIYLHAQRDLDEVVERNHTRLVRGDERSQVLGGRTHLVDGDASARISGNEEASVEGDQASTVSGNRLEVVNGNADERISGMLVTRIEGKERREVQESADLAFADDLTTRVEGCMTTLVGKADAQRSWLTHAEGTATLSSLAATELRSEGELVLRVGKSWIRITDEAIEIVSPAISAKGEGAGLSLDDAGLAISSKEDGQLLVEKKLLIRTKDGASIAMGEEVKIDGKKILLNSPEQANDAPPEEPEPLTTLELCDDEGKPLAYQRFLVTLDDGSEVSGITNAEGKAELSLKGDGKVTFPELSEVRAG